MVNKPIKKTINLAAKNLKEYKFKIFRDKKKYTRKLKHKENINE
jgi:hypothetical protein